MTNCHVWCSGCTSSGHFGADILLANSDKKENTFLEWIPIQVHIIYICCCRWQVRNWCFAVKFQKCYVDYVTLPQSAKSSVSGEPWLNLARRDASILLLLLWKGKEGVAVTCNTGLWLELSCGHCGLVESALTIMPSGCPRQFFCVLLSSSSKKNTLCADAASSQPGAVVTMCQTWENQISNTNRDNFFHFTILHQAGLCNVRRRHQQHTQAY